MDKLPSAIVQKIYEYDPTYKEKLDKTLRQLRCYAHIYRCDECFEHFNKCFCFCPDCCTYRRFCRQVYYADGDMEDDELEGIIGLSG